MGWNWAMFIAQRVHQHQSMLAANLPMSRVLVDGRPSPALTEGVALVPYADNLNIVGCSREEVQATKQKIIVHLEALGFRIHEEQDAELFAESLGFYIDGHQGKVYPKPAKAQKVRQALLWLSRRPRVSGRHIERVVGHCIHFCMLRRELLSVFRAVYDFKVVAYEKRQRLWKSAAHECLCMAALLDVCFADLRRPWSQEVTASDASLSGTAVCSSIWRVQDVQHVGRQRELWRFRASDGADRARDHVNKLDPFADFDTVKASSDSPRSQDHFQLNLDFLEVDPKLLQPENWVTNFAARMTLPEHITLLEGRGVIQALRHRARSTMAFSKRLVHLNDNLGMTLAFDRGRAKNKALLFQCRRSAALNISIDTESHFRWIPSELNIADTPSRLFERERHASKREQARKTSEAIWPGCRTGQEKGRGNTELRHQPLEAICEALPRKFKALEARRDQTIHCRQVHGEEGRKAAQAHGGAQRSAAKFCPNLPGAVCSISKDSSGLPISNRGVQHVLRTAQDSYRNHGSPGRQPHDLFPAVLQRRHGAGRGHKVPCRLDGRPAGSQSQAPASASSASATWLEEPGSWAQPSAFAVATSGQDCFADGAEGQVSDSASGPHAVCDVLQANGDSEASAKGPGNLHVYFHNLDARAQQIRGVRRIQNGRLGRACCPRLQNSAVAGAGDCKDVSEPAPFTEAVPGGVSHLFGGLEAGPRRPQPQPRLRCAISTTTQWSQLGPSQATPVTTGDQDARALDVGQQHGPIRKACCGHPGVRLPAPRAEKAVLGSAAASAASGPRLFGPNNVRRAARCLDLFSGSARLAKKLAALGFVVEAWDILFGPQCDLSKNRNVDRVIDQIKSRKFCFVHLGLPSNSWSRARCNDNRGPGPLRDDNAFLWGLPRLSQGDAAQVALGNLLLRNSIRIIRACQQSDVLWSFENPKSSLVWQTRIVRQLRAAHLHQADQCQYGKPWQKSTCFLCSSGLRLCFKTCSGEKQLCSHSNRPHVPLRVRRNGVCLAKTAEPYPWGIAQTLSKAVQTSLQQTPMSG